MVYKSFLSRLYFTLVLHWLQDWPQGRFAGVQGETFDTWSVDPEISNFSKPPPPRHLPMWSLPIYLPYCLLLAWGVHRCPGTYLLYCRGEFESIVYPSFNLWSLL